MDGSYLSARTGRVSATGAVEMVERTRSCRKLSGASTATHNGTYAHIGSPVRGTHNGTHGVLSERAIPAIRSLVELRRGVQNCLAGCVRIVGRPVMRTKR